MCDGEKVRHAWIYGGMCEIRPPVYRLRLSLLRRGGLVQGALSINFIPKVNNKQNGEQMSSLACWLFCLFVPKSVSCLSAKSLLVQNSHPEEIYFVEFCFSFESRHGKQMEDVWLGK